MDIKLVRQAENLVFRLAKKGNELEDYSQVLRVRDLRGKAERRYERRYNKFLKAKS